jgi:hypothetical protein
MVGYLFRSEAAGFNPQNLSHLGGAAGEGKRYDAAPNHRGGKGPA